MEVKYRNDFGEYLTYLGLVGNGIEIGVSEGNYSDVILSKSKLSKVYLLDTWKHFDSSEYKDITNESQDIQDKRYEMVIEKMKKYGDRVQIIKGDSREVHKQFENEFFDFIYIDANHKYEFVKDDIENWYPKMKSGGIFAGHDYMNGIIRRGDYGVKRAVDEFCTKINKTPIITSSTRRCPPSWYFRK